MIKGDSIYQVLLKHDFDLRCGTEGITEFMSKHLQEYYNDIVTAMGEENEFLGREFLTVLDREKETLNRICIEITDILKEFDSGHIKEAYTKSEDLFNSMKTYYIMGYSWLGCGGDFYRIRSGDFRVHEGMDGKKQKAELFHIKKGMRNRIGAYRYSIAGFPCLYLSSDIELAWFECGMPKQFSYCHMVINETGENALKLIDFSQRPIEFISTVNNYILNERRQQNRTENLEKIYNLLVKYIVTYPLVAACSVKVTDRSCKFVEEYIIPQLFMHWIRESDDFDGVRYKSSLNSTLVNGMGAVNVALPVKNVREDGLDEKLTARIGVSDIGYLDVNNEFKRCQDTLEDILVFKNLLRNYVVEADCAGDYIFDIIDLCDCILKTYSALINGKYENSELLYMHVDRLCDHVDLLYKSKEIIVDKCIEKIPSIYQKNIDRDIMLSHFDEFYELSKRIIIKNSVFTFSFDNLENLEHI